jgi:hypothetical protein
MDSELKADLFSKLNCSSNSYEDLLMDHLYDNEDSILHNREPLFEDR